MEKEMKVSELAALWGVSVPTVWNRIKKLGLKTLIKKNENNKDINYVYISDEQINSFVINVVNNDINNNNNVYYKEMLNDNNVDKEVINADYSVNTSHYDKDFIKDLINYNNDYNERLSSVYETFNNRLERLNNELITYKGKIPLLEDKAGREGLYLAEINDLKKEIKTKNIFNKLLLSLIITLLIIIITFATYFITLNNVSNNFENPVINSVEHTQETQQP